MLERAKNKIAQFYRTHRRMPSYAELAKLFGYQSKNAAVKLARKLEDARILSRDSVGKLIPGAFFGTARILGVVEAGFPSPAEEELTDTMSLDEYLIERKEATYLLKVKGDSMIDAGIREGDMVLVERGRTARHNDIVIAEVDGGWTMKYLRKRGGEVWLEPANATMKPIRPKEGLTIAAVVRAVIRKY